MKTFSLSVGLKGISIFAALHHRSSYIEEIVFFSKQADEIP